MRHRPGPHPPAPNPRAAGRVSLRLAALFAVALVCLQSGCSKDDARARAAAKAVPKTAVPVQAAPVTSDTARRLVEVTGTLQPYDKVTVSSEVEGSIRHVLVDLGDRVTPGQLLAEVNPEEFRIDVRQQQARLQQTLANLGLREGQDPRSIQNEDTPEVRRGRSVLVEAQQSFARASELHKEKIGTAQAVDQAQAALKTAQANLSLAEETVNMQRAQVEQARVALQLADKKLKDTAILAPFAGSISERQVAPGQFVRAQTPVFVIVQTNPLRLRTEVSERFAAAVRQDQQVGFRVDGLPGRTFNGRVWRISPSMTEQTRTLLVEALVRNDEQLLKPGMFARASIQSGETARVLMVPAQAVLNFYGVTKVFTLSEGKAQDRTVKLGDRFEERFEVLEGLREQELVAVSSLERLSTGMAVVVQGGAASQPQGATRP